MAVAVNAPMNAPRRTADGMKKTELKIIVSILIGFFACLSSLSMAQEKVIGQVVAGEQGYEIPVEVVNRNAEPIESVAVKVMKQPPGLVNFQVTPPLVATLPPGETATFLVSFDVAKEAEAQDYAEIVFSVSSANAEFDEPQPKVAVAIKEEDETEAHNAPVLKLVKIEGPTLKATRSSPNINYTEGSPGFSMNKRKEWVADYKNWKQTKSWTKELWKSELVSLKVNSFPTEIVMGTAFSLGAELKIRHGYSAHHECHDPEAESGDLKDKCYINMGVGPISIRSKAVSKSALHNHCDRETVCSKERGVHLGGWIIGEPCRTGVTEKDVEIILNCRYVPVKNDNESGQKKGDARKYRYRLEDGVSGEIETPEGDLFADWLDQNGKYASWDALIITVRLPTLLPTGEGINLHYRPVPENPMVVADYDHPEDLQKPPVNEPWPGQEGIASTVTSSGTDTQRIDNDTGEGVPDTQDQGDSERAGPIDPNALDPTDPDVANLIRQWTSTAKPPQNAVPGSNWRYDPFGRAVGSGPGVRTISTHDSVDYGGGTPEARAWHLRKELDSIDHCTLEEYVVARLKNESINHCAGRYGAVKDLKGLRLKEAKDAVTAAGFKYDDPVPGTPAKTAEADGTIERQEPGPDQYLKKGQVLKLVVHTRYVPGKVTLPDFIGEPLGEAKKWLKKNKLKMQQPKAGSRAPTREKSGTIEAQEPVAGTVMKAGGKVTFTVHSNYVDARRVPKVVEFSAGKAKALIENAGLKADPKSGGKPPSREQAGTVARQSPAAGASVPPGTKVSIFVYGPFVDTIIIPDVRKLSYEDAKRRLEAVGLSMGERDAGRPGNRDLAETAQKQDPLPGTEISRGKTVLVWFYDRYVPTREEQVAAKDCAGYPGSRAYWDDGEGKPLCRCPDGLQRNIADTACVSPDVHDRELCEKKWPGSVPEVRAADGSYNCGCPQGYVWNANKTHCVRQLTPEEVCEKKWPGSVPEVRAADGGYNCGCPPGYVWNANKTHCVRQLTPEEVCARNYPGSVPTGRAADGSVNCGCPQGYVWDSDQKKRCVRRQVARPSCSCRVDTSLMIRSDGFCTTFPEIRDPQGRLDPYGKNTIIHIVHDDQFSRGWQRPKGWLMGMYDTCENLLKYSQADCAGYCR